MSDTGDDPLWIESLNNSTSIVNEIVNSTYLTREEELLFSNNKTPKSEENSPTNLMIVESPNTPIMIQTSNGKTALNLTIDATANIDSSSSEDCSETSSPVILHIESETSLGEEVENTLTTPMTEDITERPYKELQRMAMALNFPGNMKRADLSKLVLAYKNGEEDVVNQTLSEFRERRGWSPKLPREEIVQSPSKRAKHSSGGSSTSGRGRKGRGGGSQRGRKNSSDPLWSPPGTGGGKKKRRSLQQSHPSPNQWVPSSSDSSNQGPESLTFPRGDPRGPAPSTQVAQNYSNTLNEQAWAIKERFLQRQNQESMGLSESMTRKLRQVKRRQEQRNMSLEEGTSSDPNLLFRPYRNAPTLPPPSYMQSFAPQVPPPGMGGTMVFQGKSCSADVNNDILKSLLSSAPQPPSKTHAQGSMEYPPPPAYSSCDYEACQARASWLKEVEDQKNFREYQNAIQFSRDPYPVFDRMLDHQPSNVNYHAPSTVQSGNRQQTSMAYYWNRQQQQTLLPRYPPLMPQYNQSWFHPSFPGQSHPPIPRQHSLPSPFYPRAPYINYDPRAFLQPRSNHQEQRHHRTPKPRKSQEPFDQAHRQQPIDQIPQEQVHHRGNAEVEEQNLNSSLHGPVTEERDCRYGSQNAPESTETANATFDGIQSLEKAAVNGFQVLDSKNGVVNGIYGKEEPAAPVDRQSNNGVAASKGYPHEEGWFTNNSWVTNSLPPMHTDVSSVVPVLSFSPSTHDDVTHQADSIPTSVIQQGPTTSENQLQTLQPLEGNIEEIQFDEILVSKWRDMPPIDDSLLKEILNPAQTVQCAHQVHGCFESFYTTSAKKIHEMNCPFRCVGCFFPPCNWMGVLAKFSKHIQNNHREKIVSLPSGPHILDLANLRDKKVERFLQMAYENLFVIEVHFQGQMLHAACQSFAPDYNKLDQISHFVGTMEIISVDEKPHVWQGYINVYPYTFPVPPGVRPHSPCLSVPLPWVHHVYARNVKLHMEIKKNSIEASRMIPINAPVSPSSSSSMSRSASSRCHTPRGTPRSDQTSMASGSSKGTPRGKRAS